MGMIYRTLGKSGLKVSLLGLGAGAIGADELDEGAVARLCEAALEAGVNFFDAARSYGRAEERLGRLLRGRTDVVVSTKGGYDVEGAGDWTPEALRGGIAGACRRLRRDRIDVFHLHSCPLDVLRREDLLRVLDDARAAGDIGTAGYSGENEALEWATASGHFEVVQMSLNLFDQGSLAARLPRALAAGLGVIAKRPLGNAPWRFAERPARDDVAVYWDRMRALALVPSPTVSLAELSLRFAAFSPGVGTVIVGTADPEHLREAAAALARGPLPEADRQTLVAAYARHGGGWEGLV